MKISIIHSQHSLPFLSIRILCNYAPKNLNLTILFRVSNYINLQIQEMAFKLCAKQSVGKKGQEGKQLEFAPRLHKFA